MKKNKCKDFGTSRDDKECRKCPSYRECTRVYAKKLIERRES